MPLKSGLVVFQGHWKWHHSADRIRVPIGVPVDLSYIISMTLVENCDFFISNMHSTPPLRETSSPSEFHHNNSCKKTRMMVLPECGKSLKICLFAWMWQMDGQTDTTVHETHERLGICVHDFDNCVFNRFYFKFTLLPVSLPRSSLVYGGGRKRGARVSVVVTAG